MKYKFKINNQQYNGCVYYAGESPRLHSQYCIYKLREGNMNCVTLIDKVEFYNEVKKGYLILQNEDDKNEV